MPDQLPVILPVEVSELASKVSEAKFEAFKAWALTKVETI